MSYLFTSESVSEGHPDKIADQISDAIVDNYLAFDPNSKVACEVLVTTNLVIIAGEIKSSAKIDEIRIAREVIKRIGYSKSEYLFDFSSCEIKSFLHEQSPDINQGVDKINPESQGAGDQGIMFGYACNESDNFMPISIDISHKLLEELSLLRNENDEIKYLRPDSKSQVTINYDNNNKPISISTIVISTQHDEFDSESNMSKKISDDIVNILIPRLLEKYPKFKKLFNDEVKFHINATGKFVIGGPHGDTGLTGRKIIVDTYGGKGAHGGGAFSGKDPSKVDRSAAYASRYIAKNIVAAGIADECLVQLSYAIGVSEPIGIFINTFGKSNIKLSDSELANEVYRLLDLTPYGIQNKFNLKDPIYSETASYGHMGRTSTITEKTFVDFSGNTIKRKVELFPWEKTDLTESLKKLL